MRSIVVFVFSLLIGTSEGLSQETTPLNVVSHETSVSDMVSLSRPQAGPRNNWLRSNWGLPVLYTGMIADWHSTRLCEGRPGIYEANGVLHGPDGRFSDARYWALNGSLMVALTVAEKFSPPRAKKYLNIFSAAIGGAHLGVAVHNYRLAASH